MPLPIRHARAHGIAYRDWSPDDYAFTEALYASTRIDELAPTGWPDDAKQAFLTQQHHAQHLHYQQHYAAGDWLIIEREGASIGRLYLHPFPGSIRIVDIALVPAARRQGIGGAILRDVIDWAGAQQLGVSIHVEKANPARSLYLSLGFVVRSDAGAYDLMERPLG
ncbi:GNAT superfamily N-acetyltransferase [Sphingomonas sp. BE123]|uniref:GNAT family N-acetyltransferase n=1 Tax=Sphingomonas sp. BE123 TaxID=2817842 RepID=UPI00285D25E7|nr:GNAT family N-acetyltransferase [Sphingomonas sp. BE123]MDR6850510.1 GNAT superfamily N-acetyltransferase [Sphingomonas sp. BE123]